MTEEEKALARKGPASYQAADIAFLASAKAPLNANHPGTGKTPEWIGAVWEAGLEQGCHLVIAPTAAVDGTWEEELAKWQADAPVSVEIFACTGTRTQREATLESFERSTAPVRWVVVNPAMVQYRKDKHFFADDFIELAKDKDWEAACKCIVNKKPHWHYESTYPILHSTTWTTINIDESHKGSVRNHKTITAKALNDLRVASTGKKAASSGTPMKKKGADLWGTLHYLRPDVFSSYWRFAEGFFEIDDNGYGKKVGKLRRDREREFFRMLSPYMLRRTKAECLPWLPPKQFIPVWCVMGSKQEAQYKAMEEEGAARLGSIEITTTSILAEMTRLKQFSTALCKVSKDGKVVPTDVSCKLDRLLETMEDQGMFDEGNTEKQLVFSQSRQVVDWVAAHLEMRGLKVEKITGGQGAQGQRKAIKDRFQNGDTRVLCIVTTAGGVSLTLDAADVAHFMDEMWSPEESEQTEDRLHRASRNHQVRIYQYRTKGTIEEAIQETAMGKQEAQEFILDVRRQLLAKYASKGSRPARHARKART